MKRLWVQSTVDGTWHKDAQQPDVASRGSEHRAICGCWVRCLVADFEGDEHGPADPGGFEVCEVCADLEVGS